MHCVDQICGFCAKWKQCVVILFIFLCVSCIGVVVRDKLKESCDVCSIVWWCCENIYRKLIYLFFCLLMISAATDCVRRVKLCMYTTHTHTHAYAHTPIRIHTYTHKKFSLVLSTVIHCKNSVGDKGFNIIISKSKLESFLWKIKYKIIIQNLSPIEDFWSTNLFTFFVFFVFCSVEIINCTRDDDVC